MTDTVATQAVSLNETSGLDEAENVTRFPRQDRAHQLRVVEALLFAASEPVSAHRTHPEVHGQQSRSWRNPNTPRASDRRYQLDVPYQYPYDNSLEKSRELDPLRGTPNYTARGLATPKLMLIETPSPGCTTVFWKTWSRTSKSAVFHSVGHPLPSS